MSDSVLGFCLGGGVPAGQDSACLWPGIASEVGVFMEGGGWFGGQSDKDSQEKSG
jgi:hypothetical protein